jgi:hypothetical protein
MRRRSPSLRRQASEAPLHPEDAQMLPELDCFSQVTKSATKRRRMIEIFPLAW